MLPPKNAPRDEVRAARIFELKADVNRLTDLDDTPENRETLQKFAADLTGRMREVGRDIKSDPDLSLIGLNRIFVNAWAEGKPVYRDILYPQSWRSTHSRMQYHR